MQIESLAKVLKEGPGLHSLRDSKHPEYCWNQIRERKVKEQNNGLEWKGSYAYDKLTM